MHVVGPTARYPYRETRNLMPPEATWEDYRHTAATLGLERCVVVQPSFYASDNACTLDAVARSGGKAVGVVVVDADATHGQLAALHARGARAVRSQMIVAGGLSFDGVERLAERIAPLGWHIELYLDTSDLPELAGRLRRLPVPVVFDHMGQWLPGDRIDEPGFRALLELLESGRAWTKLSNPRFEPSPARARKLIEVNPERVVWGSDWPHVSHAGAPPDDGHLLDQLAGWTADAATVHRILVSNPGQLYFQQL